MTRRAVFVGMLCLALAGAGHARAQTGGAQLAGRSVVAVRGCGRDRASFTATLVTSADGTWSAQDSDGQRFSGTWTPKGTSGRKAVLAFDPGSEAGFVAGLLADIAQRCELSGEITVTAMATKAFTLGVNRKRTRVTLVLRYLLRGTAGGRSGSARYRLNAKGPWTPAA